MTRLRAAIIGVVVVAGVTTLVVVQQGTQARFRTENEALRAQIAHLQSDAESLSNRVAALVARSSLDTDQMRELLRLRGEVGMLRRHQRDLERAAADAQSKSPRVAGQPVVDLAPQLSGPAPFQVQLVLDAPGEDSVTMTNSASGGTGETVYVQKTPLLDHTAISAATVTTDPTTGAPQIDVEFSELGRELFAEITKQNINKRLAIVLDGRLYSAPVIRSEITGGKAQVTGSFTEQEARELASRINAAIVGR